MRFDFFFDFSLYEKFLCSLCAVIDEQFWKGMSQSTLRCDFGRESYFIHTLGLLNVGKLGTLMHKITVSTLRGKNIMQTSWFLL